MFISIFRTIKAKNIWTRKQNHYVQKQNILFLCPDKAQVKLVSEGLCTHNCFSITANIWPTCSVFWETISLCVTINFLRLVQTGYIVSPFDMLSYVKALITHLEPACCSVHLCCPTKTWWTRTCWLFLLENHVIYNVNKVSYFVIDNQRRWPLSMFLCWINFADEDVSLTIFYSCLMVKWGDRFNERFLFGNVHSYFLDFAFTDW